MPLNIIETNTNFVVANTKKKELVNNINKGIKVTVAKLEELIAQKYELTGNYKKARNDIKKEIMSPLEKEVITDNGKKVTKLDAAKETLRAYNIAFTAIFRNVTGVTKIDSLSVAQIETAVTYFTVEECNKLIDNEVIAIELYKDIVKNYQVATSAKKLDTKLKKVSGK